MIKYEVPNQVTGISESVNTFEEALDLKQKFITEYIEYIKNLHIISVLIQNEDGSWTQSVADSYGNPIPVQDGF